MSAVQAATRVTSASATVRLCPGPISGGRLHKSGRRRAQACVGSANHVRGCVAWPAGGVQDGFSTPMAADLSTECADRYPMATTGTNIRGTCSPMSRRTFLSCAATLSTSSGWPGGIRGATPSQSRAERRSIGLISSWGQNSDFELCYRGRVQAWLFGSSVGTALANSTFSACACIRLLSEPS
jgi:hypothetical protein